MAVEDDGAAIDADIVPDRQTGSGLLGIRERVMALGGQVRMYTRETGGFGIHASIPVAGVGAVFNRDACGESRLQSAPSAPVKAYT